MKKILIVCLGNICRSPTAEAVLRATAEKLDIEIEIDSAGTISYHHGNLPDKRAIAAGKARGYSFKGITSRKVQPSDFEYFDLILCADASNLEDLQSICPRHLHYKISLFLSYSNASTDEIPDPYYAGKEGFELVLDLLEDASTELLTTLCKRENFEH